MSLPLVRLLVAFVGLAVAVYGLASLTGGWLGTPPWWEQRKPIAGYLRLASEGPIFIDGERAIAGTRIEISDADEWTRCDPADGRERISAALVAVGFAAAVVGLASAWPRRAKERPTNAA